MAVPFLVALGLATAAAGLELTEGFGARNALWILAGGFCAIGLLAVFAVTMKEQQQQEMDAAEEQPGSETAIGEMTSAAATQAATQLPALLLGALMQNSSLSSLSTLPVGRTVGRHMPLVLLLLVALLFWPTEQTDEGADRESESATPETDGSEAASQEERLREAA